MFRKQVFRLNPCCISSLLVLAALVSCVPRKNLGNLDCCLLEQAASGMSSDQLSPKALFALGLPNWRWVGTKTMPQEECPVVDGITPVPDECCVSDSMTPDRKLQQNDPCKPAQGWRACHLFGPRQSLPSAFQSFCLYEHHGFKPDLSVLQKLVSTDRLLDIKQDSMAVGLMAPTSLEELAWQPLQDQFLASAGRTKLLQPKSPQKEVRLAVLDTAATRDWSQRPENHPGRSPHGYTLVHMARDLLCRVDEKPDLCLARVSTRLALPYVEYDKDSFQLTKKDLAHGGYFGTIGDLAQAIRREVEKWWQRNPSARMVLNLSVAWHTVFGGLEPELNQMPPDVQAVYRALQEASCRGVLVVSAAGNQVLGPDPVKGPLLPAAWEQRPAPSQNTCNEWFQTDSPVGKDEYRPLVYAAGGVKASHNPKQPPSPLANAILGGLPRLLAYGDHGVVEGHKNQEPTAILTGSSVSSLVVSATAAAVWSYRPSLSAHDVMDLIYRYATPTKQPVDFCLGGTPAKPCPLSLRGHAVHLCKVINRVCQTGQEACPATPMDCYTSHPYPASFPLVAPVKGAHHTPCDSTDPCPQEELVSAHAQPWVLCQPGSDPCPSCSIHHAAGKLYVELSSEAAGGLSDPTLTVDGTSYSTDLGPCTPGTTAIVDLTGIPIGPDSIATLSFQLGATNSITSSLYLTE